jgi:putative transposase
METTNIVDFAHRDGMTDALTDLLRTGAQRLIATAVDVELASYLAQFADLLTETGHATVVRNGHHPERPFQTGIGPVSVRIPKVRSKDGQPVTFRSALMSPYVRRTKTLEAALPWLYLKGISSGEMAPALKVLLSHEAKGLSANTVSRLKFHLTGACTACCREGVIGPRNTTAREKRNWTTNQLSTSGRTAFIAAFGAKMTSSAPL